MGRRFVPQSTINRRMLRKDLRFQAEARRVARSQAHDARLAADLEASLAAFRKRTAPGTGYLGCQLPKPVVDVAIVPVPDQPPGPVVDVTLEPVETHPFGDPVPGEAVDIPDRIDPCAGYTMRQRESWGRRMDGKPVRLDGLPGMTSAVIGQADTKSSDARGGNPAELVQGESVMDWNNAFPSAYLKASDLAGKVAVVTIERVEFGPVGREKEMKAIIHFVGKQKALICNKVNGKAIQQIANSPLTEDWSGVAIALYPTECEFSGETVDCIRVKAVQRSQPAAPRREPLAPVLPVIQRRAVNSDNGPLTEDEIPF